MNPYFPTTFTFMDTPQPTYAFNQPITTAPFRQPYAQPAQPQPVNIESIYTTVQPYYNKEFLLTTFGNKPEYIQIFLTLSHQDKLKLYLLMQQKKIYGEITDKEAYQKILREIVQKLQNYNTFHQASQKNIQNSEQKKKKDLESKIDLFCQSSFQKLNVPKIGDNKNGEPRKNSHQQDLQEVDQWVQSTTAEEETHEKNAETQPQASESDEFQFLTAQQSNKQNLMGSSYAPPPTQAPVVFNMFNFDSQMERAMTKEIGLKDTQKLSIWEMELAQTELKNNEPSLRQVFRKKDSLAADKVHIQKTQPLQQANPPADSFDIFGSYPTSQAQQYSQETNHFMTTGSQVIFSNDTPNTYNPSQLPYNAGNFSFEFQNLYPATQQTHEAPVESKAFVESPGDQWQEGFEGVNNPYSAKAFPNHHESNIEESHQTEYTQQTPLANIQLYTPAPTFAPQPSNLNQNLFDFDILQSKVQIQPVISQQATELFLSSHGQPKAQQVVTQLNIDELQVAVPEIPQDIIQTVVDLQVGPSSFVNSQLYLPDNQKKYQILEHLKIEFSQSEKAFIRKQLKNKSFQCNAQFYLTILNHLRQANLQATSQCQHFTQQYKIVKEMHEITDKYTAVVDEQDEEKVERALRQSKALYTKIYNKSTISEKYVEHLLSEKNKEKGLHYKFGKILIDSCISTELISRVASQQNRESILNSFFLLFILQKINSLNKLKNYTQSIITFTNQQIERFKALNEETFREVEETPELNPSITNYIRGLVKITSLCERMVSLMKNCSIKSSANLVKTLKNCKQIKNRFSRYVEAQNNALYPSEYGRTLKSCVQKNFSLYDLHVKFSETAERNPICQICLIEIQGLGDQQEQKGWYHYSCFNLINLITNKSQD